MPEGKVTTIRWGIMATGGIAATFCKDLLIDPLTRGTNDLRHVIAAVASSSSRDSADSFIRKLAEEYPQQPLSACAAYGSYKELVQDSNVDIVYIATPHSHHFQNCMLCLENEKPVLCEKPITVNASQAEILYNTARNNGLFLMEAVWTRFFPLSISARQYIERGLIGEVLRVYVDNSTGVDISELSPSHRYLDKNLAGGALLDIGVYPLTWLFQLLYHTKKKSERNSPDKIRSLLAYEKNSKTDQMVSAILSFPSSTPAGYHSEAHGIVIASMILDNDPDGQRSAGATVRIQGSDGEIQVHGPTYRPEALKIIPKKGKGETHLEEFTIPGSGHGMFWEADEAGRCLRDQKLESNVMPWGESVAVMQVLDEIRSQAGYFFPENIESCKYPLELTAKRAEE